MKIYTKLFIAGAIFFVLAIITIPEIMVFSMFCFMGGFALLIIQGATEITNKNKPPYENKNKTPPWEK